MKCQEVIDKVDGYLDDRIDVEEKRSIRIHLEDCPDCADEFDLVSELRNRVSRMPKALEPPNDLWPGIAARIADQTVERGRFARRMLLAAAAVVLLAGSVTVAFFAGRSSSVPIVEYEKATESSGTSQFVLASLEGLGVEDYESTRGELLDALDARRGDLSPETVDVVMMNLQLIDDAMAEIAEALGNDPESEFLMKRLARAYRQQIDLLQQAIRLPAEV